MYIALTGTICSGKTGVTDRLIERRYNLREELARPLIARRIEEKSNELPWSKKYEDQFQLDLLERHLELDPILHYGNGFCFQDTTYLDPLTFLRANQVLRHDDSFNAPYSEAEKKARNMINAERTFREKHGNTLPTFQRVFCLKPLDVYKKDPQREFNSKYAQILHDAKKEIYTNEFGYEMIDVPTFEIKGTNVDSSEKVSRSIDKRVEFILDNVPK